MVSKIHGFARSRSIAIGSAILIAGALGVAAPSQASAAGRELCDSSTLNPSTSLPLGSSLRVGIKSSAAVTAVTREVQTALWINSVTDARGRDTVIDGKYGTRTAEAVRKFQRAKHLPVTGRVGTPTWKALAKATCPGSSTTGWSRLKGQLVGSSSETDAVTVWAKGNKRKIGWWELSGYGVARPGATDTFRIAVGGEGDVGGTATVRIVRSTKTFTITFTRNTTSVKSFKVTYRKV